uniref:Secreted protein n=1 Tax=Hanusia phi TaxID=3032 RepID=A0A7S0NFE4_9CRYP
MQSMACIVGFGSAVLHSVLVTATMYSFDKTEDMTWCSPHNVLGSQNFCYSARVCNQEGTKLGLCHFAQGETVPCMGHRRNQDMLYNQSCYKFVPPRKCQRKDTADWAIQGH